MRSTREIGRLIQEIRDATNTAVLATEAGLKATEAGARSAGPDDVQPGGDPGPGQPDLG